MRCGRQERSPRLLLNYDNSFLGHMMIILEKMEDEADLSTTLVTFSISFTKEQISQQYEVVERSRVPKPRTALRYK
jgi:hypothetical protein